jgi:Mlc titration factor MtfA (ptsG expression regulator)
MSLLETVKQFFTRLFGLNDTAVDLKPLSNELRTFLSQNVSFYAALNETEKSVFEQRAGMFLRTTQIIGHDVEVTEQDKLLVASAAIMLVWRFPDWYYVNLHTVSLVSGSFNEHSQFGQPDSGIQGMVGTGAMRGQMILSKPALHYGFSNDRDKKNVALHEFSHLLDTVDGGLDGFPERLSENVYSVPWLDLVRKEIDKIHRKQSNIRDYGGTNPMEFFAVATEYFFERPSMLCRKHPEVYETLKSFYLQDVAAIAKQIKPRKKAPCPCGSGKRYKRCCYVSSHS